MCSNYQRSIYNIMMEFDALSPRSASDVSSSINGQFSHFFFLGLPLYEVIQNLLQYGMLRDTPSGFVLSKNGKEWREKLSKLVPDSIS